MSYLGEISADSDSPGMRWQKWIDLIRDHPNLVASEPRESINPFTKQPMTLRPRPGSVRVVVDGKDVGSMSWDTDESDSAWINVSGEESAVVPVALDVARSLGARFKAVAGESPPGCMS